MKQTLRKLVFACGLLVLPAFLSAPMAAASKCATCSELLQSCRTFCGSSQVNFNCQNHNPCAGTCTCQ